jgi:hypothetical protein
LRDGSPALLEKCPILVVRHAYSNFNYALDQFRRDRKARGYTHEDYVRLRASKELIDPLLHDEGVK